LAEHGATEWEIAAYLGHENTKLTAIYVKNANRSVLGASGMARLKRANPDQDLSNLDTGLDTNDNKCED
ncbi:MAG: integrase, partial [Yoonia sp.]